jgi:hypothetical protein
VLPPGQVTRLLEERAGRLRAEIGPAGAVPRLAQSRAVPRLLRLDAEYRKLRLEAEHTFVRRMIGGLAGGGPACERSYM